MKKIFTLSALLAISISFIHAQDWLRDMRDPTVNFFTVQQEYNAWWTVNGQAILQNEANATDEREGAWHLYKKWEHDMLPHMTATGGVRLGAPDPAEQALYHQRLAAQHSSLRSGGTAAWTYIGAPHSFDDGSGDSSAGRVNCVRFDPINRNIIYAGAPSGGLWKSMDFGHTWAQLNSDLLPQIGLSDIAINPQNPNTIYIATGDEPNSACISIGVLKSIDGGQTWDTTGLSWTVSQGRLISRLIMDPLDSNTMFAATNVGIYKTRDGGVTWTAVLSVTGFTGMEMNPLNPATIYAWGSQVYRSVDTGDTWHILTGGLPGTGSTNGFAVGLTPADTSCIYVMVSSTGSLAAGSSYFAFNGVYRSLNAGSSFTLMNANPDPANNGTQSSYDLTIGVSPVNRDHLVIGAVNSAFSTNGGTTWANANTATVSHVDHHDVRYFPGSADTVFSADDGGLFISTDGGQDWQGLNDGLHIGQVYNISSSSQSKYLYISGRQDEGTLVQDTTFERLLAGGDGLECIIDPDNQNSMYGSVEEGIIGHSTDGGVSLNIIATNFFSGVNGPGAWNTPFALGPNNSQTIYVAKDYVYESNDGGGTFTQLNSPDLASEYYYTHLVIAPSDTNYIYAGGYYNLYRSADGGNTFTAINVSSLGMSNYSALAVSPVNPLEIWVGYSNSTSHAAGLYKSINGGSTYTLFNTGLPAGASFVPVSIAPVRNSPDAIYVSLDNAGGVYYIDSTMTSWMPYSAGLPNVTVDQIEIDYCSNKVRAATYGRDLWETGPYQPLNVPPTALASYSGNASQCPSVTETFTDHSNFVPTSWAWYFPGGTPDTSTQQNPVVTYPGGGTGYTVTFIASNAYGSDTAQYFIQTDYCTGIDQPGMANAISIYPNPTNGLFTLSVTGASRGVVDVAVTDGEGQNVYTRSLNKTTDAMTTDCALSHLASGIYYIHITTDGASSVQKLVLSE